MNKRINRKKFKTGTVILLVIAVIVGLILFMMNRLNQPANGTIIQANTTELTTPQPSVRTLDSKYFTAQYSGRYQLLPSTEASASLQYWTLVAHQQAGGNIQRKLSIIVAKLPEGGVKEDSAYKLYDAHPELYQLTQVTYSGETVFAAKRSDPTFQQTVLWPHGEYLLTVTLTAATETDTANDEFQSLLTSLRWR